MVAGYYPYRDSGRTATATDPPYERHTPSPAAVSRHNIPLRTHGEARPESYIDQLANSHPYRVDRVGSAPHIIARGRPLQGPPAPGSYQPGTLDPRRVSSGLPHTRSDDLELPPQGLSPSHGAQQQAVRSHSASQQYGHSPLYHGYPPHGSSRAPYGALDPVAPSSAPHNYSAALHDPPAHTRETGYPLASIPRDGMVSVRERQNSDGPMPSGPSRSSGPNVSYVSKGPEGLNGPQNGPRAGTGSGPGTSRPVPRRQYSAVHQPRQPSISIKDFQTARSNAELQPASPDVQLELAKKYIDAATQLAGYYVDPNTTTSAQVDTQTEARNRAVWTSEAYKITKRLARTNYPPALFYLAVNYSSGGMGLEVDNVRAFELYSKSAKANYPAACYRVAVCYELGVGIKRDLEAAVSWYKTAAQLGDVSSMYKLGMMCLRGSPPFNRNIGEAFLWLQRAVERADKSTPHAVHELGILYENGVDSLGHDLSFVDEKGHAMSVTRDKTKAVDLFTKAADLGYAPSQYRLGRVFEFGQLGYPVDPAKSIYWYTLGAEAGDPECELSLSGWYWTGAEGHLRQSDTEAFLWAQKAASKKHSRAEFALGYFYEIGIGVPIDINLARIYYQRAFEKKHPKALERLNALEQLPT